VDRSAPFPYRDLRSVATRNPRGRGKKLVFLTLPNFLVMTGSTLAMGSYLFLQVSPKIVPDALGTTVLTVGGGGLVVAIAAIFKDFWAYKKAQVDSAERQAKEDRESRERIEMQRLGIDRLKITQSKNNRLTTKMLEWMELAHETQTFPPPPPRVNLTEERPA
jgi:tRNA(Met) C34 N-acetyltransferase TmcA